MDADAECRLQPNFVDGSPADFQATPLEPITTEFAGKQSYCQREAAPAETFVRRLGEIVTSPQKERPRKLILNHREPTFGLNIAIVRATPTPTRFRLPNQ